MPTKTTTGLERSTFTCAYCSATYSLNEKESFPDYCSQCQTRVNPRPNFYQDAAFARAAVESLAKMAQPFIKHDTEKTRWDLLPPSTIEGAVRVLMHGAKKYSDDNWKKGADWSRYYSASKRHIEAWWEGEDLDLDSGLHHLDHAMCCLIFLAYFAKRSEYVSFDNRPRHKIPTISNL